MGKRLLITGAGGMAATAIYDTITENSCYSDYYDVFCSGRDDANLTSENETYELISERVPDIIIHTAANVGGIGKNLKYPYNLFVDNIRMNTNVIDAASYFGVKKLITFCSVCIFPNNAPELNENNVHGGEVYDANFAYGYAKRMVDVQLKALKRQYPEFNNYSWVAPSNIFYHTNDNFHLENAHIIPALIHKLYLAKTQGTDFTIWGDGSSLREFMWMGDTAKCIMDLLELEQMPHGLLLCGEKENSIREIVEMLVEISGFQGNVIWDTSKPNGQKARPSNKTLFRQYFPNMQYTPIYEGLKLTWERFQEDYPNVRK